jgi:hypothetical protein
LTLRYQHEVVSCIFTHVFPVLNSCQYLMAEISIQLFINIELKDP